MSTAPVTIVDGENGYDLSYAIEINRKGLTPEEVADILQERKALIDLLPKDSDIIEDVV